jgi:hypothetical protein
MSGRQPGLPITRGLNVGTAECPTTRFTDGGRCAQTLCHASRSSGPPRALSDDACAPMLLKTNSACLIARFPLRWMYCAAQDGISTSNYWSSGTPICMLEHAVRVWWSCNSPGWSKISHGIPIQPCLNICDRKAGRCVSFCRPDQREELEHSPYEPGLKNWRSQETSTASELQQKFERW